MKTNFTNTLFISFIAIAAVGTPAVAQTTDQPSASNEYTQDQSVQVEVSRKELNEEKLKDLKEERDETRERAKEARRIEKEANAAAKEARNAYKAERKAQKARELADKQARKADKVRRKAELND